MDANVYQHFRADERSFIDSVGDWIEQVQGQYAPYLTEFLDPRQSYILEALVRQETELRYSFYVGYEQAERKRCLIFPEYYQPEDEDFEGTLYECQFHRIIDS